MAEIAPSKLEEIQSQNLEIEVGEGISEVSEGVSNIFDKMVKELEALRKNS